MAAQTKETEEVTFETALNRLETIVQTMESSVAERALKPLGVAGRLVKQTTSS